MIKITVFSGHEGQLRWDTSFYLTLFGGVDLVRPTVARQILTAKTQQQPPLVGADRDGGLVGRAEQARFGPPPYKTHRPFFLTVFGGVDIKSPTLAAEFMDLREMVRSGSLTLADWDRSIAMLAHADFAPASFTLFGGFDECSLPSESDEVDSLALQQHMGNIPSKSGQVLQMGIGRHETERLATVRRAIEVAHA
jgi:hypothetical protein